MAARPDVGPEALEGLARELETRHDLGTTVSLEPVSQQGQANYNLVLLTDRGRYLVRLCLEQPREKVEREIEILADLARAGIPLARPILTSGGEALLDTGSGRVVVYEFLEGEHPPSTPGVIREVGRTLARLHDVPVRPELEVGNSITVEDVENRADVLLTIQFSPRDLAQDFAREVRHLSSAVRQPLPRSWIHADLFPDNVIFDGERLVGLIDFEEICVDTCLLDLGIAAQGFCFEGPGARGEKLEALLEGYESQRPLTPRERALWPDFVSFGGLLQATWHLGRLLRAPDRRREARIRELVRRSEWIRREGLSGG